MRNGLENHLLILLIIALSAFSQSGTGSITGTVIDPNGAMVAGATVTVINNATNKEATTTTNDDGTYTVPSLVAGPYTITIIASGFKQTVVTGVEVDKGNWATGNLSLEIGYAQETVTVAAGGESLQTQTATLRHLSVNGLPGGAPNISLDGVDVQDNLLSSSHHSISVVSNRKDYPWNG